ncbi:hypothetical protein EGW08_004319 [Elysia chlorotica]|uniref:RRM domain-containing protein n=1 Tax=Elysia chlorotica TaxID=188477 RepID=A0A3S1CB31_ELYCH|nr:hypothetical protein EGW08_004319 [Elysia chlorotica]
MVRETRYLIVRNLPESCSEETVIDHFQRYGKIQSVKLQAAKENGGTGTATVAFNDIKSAAKAHHASNSLGEATLRTDYWEGSTQTPVLVASVPPIGGAPGTAGSSARGVTSSGGSYANPPASRPVSSFASWAKGPVEDDGGLQDKGDSNSALSGSGGGSASLAGTLPQDKSATSFDIPRGRARERFNKKKKFEKSGSFGRHGTSSRSLEAARSQSEAAAAAANTASAPSSSSLPSATQSASSLSAPASSSSSSVPHSAPSSTMVPSAVSSSAGSGSVGVTSSSIAPPAVSSNGPLSSSSSSSLTNHPVIVLTDGKDATNISTASAAATTTTANNSTAAASSSSSSSSAAITSAVNNIINNNNNNGSGTPAGKDSTTITARDSSSNISRSRPHTASPSSRHGTHSRHGAAPNRKSGSHRSRSGSLASRSRSRSHGSRSSSSRSDSSGTSRSTSPHRSFSNSTMRPQSMVGASRLVSSSDAKDLHVRRSGEDSSATGDADRRSLGICVTGLPMRSTDSSLRDGLYHEYKKHGKVTTVQIFGEGDNRCAVVSFRKPEDASKALEASQGKTFFGAKIKVTSHEGVEVDDTDRSSDNDSMDEYHQKSTRTLFVGNLEKETTTQDLIDKFRQFGEIIDVDIKRQGATTAFAFVQYVDIASVVAAWRAMEGEHIGINKIKLGFGKSMPTCCVWLDNIPNDMSNRALRSALGRYGEISYSFVDRHRNKSLVCFNSFEDAQHCVSDIKQRPHFLHTKKKLQIDFASRECHTDFLDIYLLSPVEARSLSPDESRVHKFRSQRGVDNYQDDGSPSTYGFNSTRGGGSVFNAPRNSSRNSSTSGSRRSRAFNDYPEENHSSSRRSSRREDFSTGGAFYSKSGDDYDAVLREYGHSQRERRERDQSPRRVDSQSRRGSRDVSLDRYDDQRSKDRAASSVHNSRDTSPSSEHNSFRSESHRYRSSRDEKYSSRTERYTEDSKGEGKDFDVLATHSHRSSRMASPQYINSNSMHSHESDFGTRRGSRAGSRGSPSQSPDVTLVDDTYSTSARGGFYPEDYKRSVVADDDIGSPYSSSKRRDVIDIDSASAKSRSLALLSNNKLGAEVAKTAAEKGRKRIFDENLSASTVAALDQKLLRKLEKSSPLSGSEREKARHMFGKLNSGKHRSGGGTVGSPGGLSSGGSQGGGSENGSAGEDLHHLHQRKQILLMQIKELGDDAGAGAALVGGAGTTSDSDSPHFVKSVAVKDALRRSGRTHDASSKTDEDRLAWRADKLRRSTEIRRSDSRGPYYPSREDRVLGFDEEGSLEGNHSDSDYDSEKQRSKRRRAEAARDSESVKSKDYHRQGSVELSDSEDFDKKPDISARLNSSALEGGRSGCDIRSNSLGSNHLYEDKTLDMSTSPCDNGDLFKDRLSDKDILVINKHRNLSKSNASYLSRKNWSKEHNSVRETSPVNCFSPALSDRGEEEDSVASSSLTEKSSKHPSSPPAWKCALLASPVPQDNDSDPDLSYLNNFEPAPDPLDDDMDDECLSDSSLVGGEKPPGPEPGEASYEERIRAIDRFLNMVPSSKVSQEFSLGGGLSSSASLASTKEATNNNDGGAATNLYAKYRIRKREEGTAVGGAADVAGVDNSSVIEQPSLIVQRVLSKKSILDQDFKRLEQFNKYDSSSGILGSTSGNTCGVLKDMPQLMLPTSASTTSLAAMIKEEPLESPRSLSSKLAPPSSALWPPLSPSVNPVTTSSSVLQPTVTTSMAGSTLAISSSSSSLSLPSSSIPSALGSSSRALTTSSVSAPISSISVSYENSLDKSSVKTSSVTLKTSSSSSGSSSKTVGPQSNLLSSSSSSSPLSSILSTVTTKHTSVVSSSVSSSSSSIPVLVSSSTSHVLNVKHSSSSASSVSSSLSSSVLSSTLSNSSSIQIKPEISSSQFPTSLTSSSSSSSVTLSVTTSVTSSARLSSSIHPVCPPATLTAPVRPSCVVTSGGDLTTPAAAPFTQGHSSKSQLVPTLGQEAPLLSSSGFDPEPREANSTASDLCPRLPGDHRSAKVTAGHAPDEKKDPNHPSSKSGSAAVTTNRSGNNPELTINLWGSKADQTSANAEDNTSSKSSKSTVLLSKPEVVTPDIESPVSVKSGTSSTDSVPLSSLDTKPCIAVSEEKTANLLSADHGGAQVKVEPVSPAKKSIENIPKENNTDGKDHNDKTSSISNILVPKKCELSVPVSATQATVLTVSSKNCPEKDEKLSSSDLCPLPKGKLDSISPSSSASLAIKDEDGSTSALQTSRPSSSSVSTTSSSSSMAPITSVTSTKPSTDKSEKKTPSKPSARSSASGRTEALFAPDVKLEQPQQKATSSSSSSSKDSKHRDGHKASSQSGGSKPSSISGGSSGGNDKKSVKSQSSKDSGSGDKKESTSGNSEKTDRKTDSAHKAHETSSKSKEADKSKIKEKRDQSKDGEKGSRKEKEEAKRKEDKRSLERKDERKGSLSKEEKKNEKKLDDKKDKSAMKQDTLKHSKSDQDLNKKEKDKKLKEKTKESGGKDKLDKKLIPGLSCVSKHSASPDAKPETKLSKGNEGKASQKESTSKADKEKQDSTTSKSDSKAPTKQEAKHKGDQKSSTKAGDSKLESKEMQAKKSNSDGSQKVKKESDKTGSDSQQKGKKDEEKQSSDGVSKGKKDSEKSSADSVQKSKKEGEKEKDATKQSSSKHSDKAQRQKQKEEERLKEKQRLKEQKEKEEKERKEKEEKEKQKEREEKERQKEKEREERERQKEKEREEKERQKAEKEKKEKEEKERKEREEKERLRREKEERERQKEKEREERERQKEKEREDKERKEKEERERLKKEKEEKEKAKQKEREEKERLEKEKRETEEKERLKKEKERKEKKEKEKKKAKEEKLKKEKEEKEKARAKKEKEEKMKKEREEKEKAKKEKEKKEKEKDKDREKEDKEEKKKAPPPKKQKRNELAALLDSNDSFPMIFTSMYDRVKTQRNREAEHHPNKSPSSASQRSSTDKHKKSSSKKSKSKSALYYSTSDLSDDDNLSETNDSEDQSSKLDLPSKESKPKKTKQVKKRPHVSSSSSSSSSCEDDDDALLSATKSKGGKKTDIFSSDSEDESFPPPSSKSTKQSKSKSKPPAPKKKKVRADSLDSVGSNSKDGFVKPQLLSSVTETESLDDMDLSETELPKVSKVQKKKSKTTEKTEKRDSSVESLSKKSSKADRDSSVESVVRKPSKPEKSHKNKTNHAEKDDSPPLKKAKLEPKKAKHGEEKDKSSVKEDARPATDDKKADHTEDLQLRKSETKKESDASKDPIKSSSDKHKSKDKLSAEKSSQEAKNLSEKKKKKEREDGTVKKKKKKKYDSEAEEAQVNSLLTKMYADKERKKKKAVQSVFDIESDDLSLSEASLDVSQDKKSSLFSKEEASSVKAKDKKVDPLFDTEEDIEPEEKPQKVKLASEAAIKLETMEKANDQNKKEDQAEKKKEDHVEKHEKKKDDHIEKQEKKKDDHIEKQEKKKEEHAEKQEKRRTIILKNKRKRRMIISKNKRKRRMIILKDKRKRKKNMQKNKRRRKSSRIRNRRLQRRRKGRLK